MRKSVVVSCATMLIHEVIGIAGATLEVIGAANYLGGTYNLIYENDQDLVWLDYTRDRDWWQNQVNWAAGLNGAGILTCNLNPGVTISWNGDWRLLITDERKANLFGGEGWQGPDESGYHFYSHGYNMVNSEMGHLFYESLGNKGFKMTDGTYPSDYGLQIPGPFENLTGRYYWSVTESSLYDGYAWTFIFNDGWQGWDPKNASGEKRLAVSAGQVSLVPEPATMLLLASGLVGLAGLRRKYRGC